MHINVHLSVIEIKDDSVWSAANTNMAKTLGIYEAVLLYMTLCADYDWPHQKLLSPDITHKIIQILRVLHTLTRTAKGTPAMYTVLVLNESHSGEARCISNGVGAKIDISQQAVRRLVAQ